MTWFIVDNASSPEENVEVPRDPFSCDFCEKSFPCVNSKIVHERVKHTLAYFRKHSSMTASKSSSHVTSELNEGENPGNSGSSTNNSETNGQNVESPLKSVSSSSKLFRGNNKTRFRVSSSSKYRRRRPIQKQVKCRYCGKLSSTESNRKVHERVHTGN